MYSSTSSQYMQDIWKKKRKWKGRKKFVTTHRWRRDWCRRRSCHTASRSGSPQDLPQVCWRSWRRTAHPPCSNPPCLSLHWGGSHLCSRLNPCPDRGCRCCGSACSGTLERSPESPAVFRWPASSPGQSLPAEKKRKVDQKEGKHRSQELWLPASRFMVNCK